MSSGSRALLVIAGSLALGNRAISQRTASALRAIPFSNPVGTPLPRALHTAAAPSVANVTYPKGRQEASLTPGLA